MVRHKKGALLLCCLFAVCLALPAVVHAFGDEIVVGALVPLTKKGASYGVQIRAAIEIAVDEINAKGGINGKKVKLALLDTEGSNAMGIQAVQKLINREKVIAVHGPDWSAVSEAVFPVCNRAKILCFSPTSTKPGVAEPYEFAYRNTIDENKLVPDTMGWIKKNYPWVKKAALLTDIKDAYSKSLGHDTFRREIVAAGIELVEEVDYVTGDTDFSAHITKIKAKNPDMIAVGGTWVETANMMKEARKQGLKVLWVGGVGMGNKRLMENAGDAAEGGVFNSTYNMYSKDPQNAAYIAELKKRVPKEDPHWPAANSYDAMKMLAVAIERANIGNTKGALAEDRIKVRDALGNLKNYPGITSPKINMIPETGDADKVGNLLQVQKAEFVLVGEGLAPALKIR